MKAACIDIDSGIGFPTAWVPWCFHTDLRNVSWPSIHDRYSKSEAA
jgi:hypothetical protein